MKFWQQRIENTIENTKEGRGGGIGITVWELWSKEYRNSGR